jgi:hypothetical protein
MPEVEKMAKKTDTKKKPASVEVPTGLAQLLTAEPSDLKDPATYAEVQKLAKSLLRLLMVAQ